MRGYEEGCIAVKQSQKANGRRCFCTVMIGIESQSTKRVTDREIAAAIADHVLSPPGWRDRYFPHVFHSGSGFPLQYTHHRKTYFWFVTADRGKARSWIINAALRGYAVFRGYSLSDTLTGGPGTIAQVRERGRLPW